MFSKLVKTYVRLKQKNKYLETMLNPKGRKPKENKTTMIWKLCSILKANNPPNHCFFCFLPLGLSIVSRSLFFCVNGIPRGPPNSSDSLHLRPSARPEDVKEGPKLHATSSDARSP